MPLQRARPPAKGNAFARTLQPLSTLPRSGAFRLACQCHEFAGSAEQGVEEVALEGLLAGNAPTQPPTFGWAIRVPALSPMIASPSICANQIRDLTPTGSVLDSPQAGRRDANQRPSLGKVTLAKSVTWDVASYRRSRGFRVTVSDRVCPSLVVQVWLSQRGGSFSVRPAHRPPSTTAGAGWRLHRVLTVGR
jgi:hypothetical protein